MQSHTANFYVPAQAAVQPPSFTLDVFPGGKRETLTHRRHSRRYSHDIENVCCDRNAPVLSLRKDRRKTIDYGLNRLPLNPWNDATTTARILPQRIVIPKSSTGIQSIWFQSRNEHPDLGVSLADVVDEGAEIPMVAPQEQVFLELGLDCEEMKFSILWPGYGHVSWIALIPINPREGSGYQCGPITRRLLASAVAQHFQAFMMNHAYLRFPNTDPDWKIMNKQESGIKFEDLRLTRLFSHKDEAGKLDSWQAEILVIPGMEGC